MATKTSAIRVTVNRHLSESEKEWVRDILRFDSNSVAFTDWNGFTYKWTKYPFHVRLSKRGKFWVHSDTVEARRLYRMFVSFLEGNFVNIHPTAVRTFSSIPAKKDRGRIEEDIFEQEAKKRGWLPPEEDVEISLGDIVNGSADWEVLGLVDV